MNVQPICLFFFSSATTCLPAFKSPVSVLVVPLSLLATATLMPLVLLYGFQKPRTLNHAYIGGMKHKPKAITQAVGALIQRSRSRRRIFNAFLIWRPLACLTCIP